MKIDTVTPKTPEEIGERVAFFLKWEGHAITAAFLAALTDANFHTLRAQLEPIIKQHLEG
jgi:hypothetical protein